MRTGWQRLLTAAAGAALVAACAQSPQQPSSSLPEQVIRNVPPERSIAGDPLPLPVIEAPLHDEMPPIPIRYANTRSR